jgi:tRNA (cytidine/uridine-2'-O-)-methyltransferase
MATGATLHLIRPFGFELDDKHLRRAGLDYWEEVDVRVWDSLADLRAAADPSARFWWCSTKATRTLWQAEFRRGDYLVFGPETRGLPESLLATAGEQAIRVPMRDASTRSLNLATAVAIVLYEAARQQAGCWEVAGME